jgi:hypothetical protein
MEIKSFDYSIPEKFSKFFWSEWPTKKTTLSNGVSIAYRLFMNGSIESWDWAISHIKNDDIFLALNGRGMNPDTKNYIKRNLNA